MYKNTLKKIALISPILGSVVKERDHLRNIVHHGKEENRNLTETIENLTIKIKKLTDIANSKENKGYCNCCRNNTIFKITGEWLRDNYFCSTCHSIPRQRHIQYILDNHYPDWESKTIHESSPSNKLISDHCAHYTSSQYLDNEEEGRIVNGVRCENLERLTFPNDSFDIFITQDVFEHIFNPEKATQEILRVLKPGGIHIFTAPKHKNLTKSHPRAILKDGKIEYLEKEVYHGNPVGDGRALVTWDYGDDFEILLNKWSNTTIITTTYITKDRNFGIDGEYIEVFVMQKPMN